MKIESRDLVEEFYQSIKDDYPEYSFNQIKDTVYGPWRYLVSLMKRGDLPKMRIKYFGTFVVNKGTAVMHLKALKKQFEENKINHTQYFKLKKMLEGYLEKLEENE